MSTASFYADLAALQGFSEFTLPAKYVDVPDDWLIVITDVVMSTAAIEAGQYKDVNMLGAAVIAAMQNLDKNTAIPFVFGGDGATVLIPQELGERAKAILLGVQKMGKSTFNLDLRIAIVPVAAVYQAQQALRIAKIQLGASYHQAVLAGEGIAYAENLVKDLATSHLYAIDDDGLHTMVDYTGFSCRWQDVPSPKEETVSWIIQVRSGTPEAQSQLYAQILEQLEAIYGPSDEHHPLRQHSLDLTLNLNVLAKQSNLKTGQTQLQTVLLWTENLLGTIADKLPVEVPLFPINHLRDQIMLNTDYRKFDGSLKLILAGTTAERLAMQAFLQPYEDAGKLVYGVHMADRALLTCLVSQGTGQEVHFVDGADGGYALAAKSLKGKLKKL